MSTHNDLSIPTSLSVDKFCLETISLNMPKIGVREVGCKNEFN
jgi:hypothetical protein